MNITKEQKWLLDVDRCIANVTNRVLKQEKSNEYK